MKILLLEDDTQEIKRFKDFCQNLCEVIHVTSLQEIEKLNSKEDFLGAFLDIHIEDQKIGFEALEILQRKFPNILKVMMSFSEHEEDITKAFSLGAFAYLAKPYTKDIIKQYVLHMQIHLGLGTSEVLWIGSSVASKKCLHDILQASRTDLPVLIEGPTGSGKELAAKQLFNYYTSLKNLQLLSLNCSTLPESLFESIFFGADKGAYTGSFEHRKGLVEHAAEAGGALFLDEIGSLSLENQAKLLRFLESGEFMRLGDPKMRIVKIKVICADHQSLEKLVHEKKFREDLYHRIKSIHIMIPSLQSRPEDIPELAQYFVNTLSQNTKRLTKEAENFLTDRPYPGNVRELKHIIASAIIFSRSPLLFLSDFQNSQNTKVTPEENFGHIEPLETKLRQYEKTYVQHVLHALKDDKKKAAEVLQISLASLYSKIK